jgi:hypothetical protein
VDDPNQTATVIHTGRRNLGKLPFRLLHQDSVPRYLNSLSSGHAHRSFTERVNVSPKLPQLDAMNTLTGNVNTALHGAYLAIAFVKHAHRWLA